MSRPNMFSVFLLLKGFFSYLFIFCFLNFYLKVMSCYCVAKLITLSTCATFFHSTYRHLPEIMGFFFCFFARIIIIIFLNHLLAKNDSFLYFRKVFTD